MSLIKPAAIFALTALALSSNSDPRAAKDHAAQVRPGTVTEDDKLRAEVVSLRQALEAEVRGGEMRAARINELYQPGMVVAFAGSRAPEGWVLCHGQLLDGDRPEFARLRAAIGTTFGAGDGQQFRVPDLRGRAAIGAGQGDKLSMRKLGESLGDEKHTLTTAEMPAHNHGGATGRSGAHTHDVRRNNGATIIRWGDGGGSSANRIDAAGGPANEGALVTSRAGDHTHTINSDGGGEPHNNMQPSLALNYLIKL